MPFIQYCYKQLYGETLLWGVYLIRKEKEIIKIIPKEIETNTENFIYTEKSKK